jgi:hypothetical protein
MTKWRTTNPRNSHSAAQTGWKLHAVNHDRKAECGLLAKHGWGLDLFVDTKCTECIRALEHAVELAL